MPTLYVSNINATGVTVTGTTILLSISGITDPVKIIGLQSAADTTVLTIDGSGVIHTIPVASISGGSSINYFTDLLDVPHSYSGNSGKTVAVKSDETGLEFVTSAVINLNSPVDGDILVYSASSSSFININPDSQPFGTAVSASSATSLTMSVTKGAYVFFGVTDSTYILPPVSGNTNSMFFLKNRGTANIILTSTTSNSIYTTAAVSTASLLPGESCTLLDDGTYWSML